MAAQTNAGLQYGLPNSIREDLENIVYSVKEDGCVFCNMIDRVPVSQKTHEWTKQEFPSKTNTPLLEGRVYGNIAIADRTRLNNHCQINGYEIGVSRSHEKADKAGIASELGHQVELHTMALKAEIESAIIGVNQAKVAGNASTARQAASVQAWIFTNDILGSAGSPASPTGDGTDARADGTQEAFTEAKYKQALENIFNSTRKPSTQLTTILGSHNKQAFSTFVGRATETHGLSKDKTIYGAVDYYQGDFGMGPVYASALIRTRDCLVFDPRMWAMGVFEKMDARPVMQGQFDGEAMAIDMEWTLIARNELSSALIADLTDA